MEHHFHNKSVASLSVTTSSDAKPKMDDKKKHAGMRLEIGDDVEKLAERRWARKGSVVDEQKDNINDLADAFIENFRSQLRIQREESFKRFRDMLARGT